MINSRSVDLVVCKILLLPLFLLLVPSLVSAIDPPLNPRGVEVAQSTVKWEWDWVPGASNYEVTIDGYDVFLTSERQVFSRDTWSGDHSLSVKAVSAEWQYSSPSKTAKINVRSVFDSTVHNQSYRVGESVAAVTELGVAPPPVQSSASNDPVLIDPTSLSIPEAFQKDGYELSFSDEFNGSQLNDFRWNTQLRWDGEFNGERYEYRVINGEDQFYVNNLGDDQEHKDLVVPAHNPFEFDGSRLAIRAIRNPLKTRDGKRSFGPLRDVVSQQTFLSGAISSFDKFTQKYGYFEARMKIPSHVGTFPAFWLHHQRQRNEGTHRSEIDVMENLGHAPWFIYNSFHYYNNVSATYGGDGYFLKPQPEGQIFTGVDYSEDYHIYAVEWSPSKIIWYIDGQQVSELANDNVNHEELYLILNMAMGGNWTNYPANSGGLGRSDGDRYPTDNDLSADNFRNPALEIDYVRVYKRR